MKTCVLGFPDVEGLGVSTLLFGPEHGVENNRKEFKEIKISGQYPSGIRRVELWCDEHRMREVGISIVSNSPKSISKKEKKKNEKSVY